jgi:hypothetical protein
VVFWIPAFAGMTAGTGADIRHAGERRHPRVLPRTQLLNLKKYNITVKITWVLGHVPWREIKTSKPHMISEVPEINRLISLHPFDWHGTRFDTSGRRMGISR